MSSNTFTLLHNLSSLSFTLCKIMTFVTYLYTYLLRKIGAKFNL